MDAQRRFPNPASCHLSRDSSPPALTGIATMQFLIHALYTDFPPVNYIFPKWQLAPFLVQAADKAEQISSLTDELRL